MLQMSNLDDVKSEWNVNETHIIIPMIDGNLASNKDSDKIARTAITLNGLDGEDPSSGLEHSLVIGLDRNLFESDNNKSDLLVIQNSDLKLLSCNSELKNSIAYTLTYVDQDRNEIVWESPIKDRSKPDDWCPSDKPIFEVKDVLNYDDSVQDSSRNWQDELEKSDEHINLVVTPDLITQVSKIGDGILMPDDDEISGKKTSDDIDDDQHFIVSYYPIIQGCDEDSSVLSKSPVVSVSEEVTNSNEQSVTSENENLIESKSDSDTIIREQFDSSNWDKSHSVQSVNESNSNHFKNDERETVLDLMAQKEVEQYDESFPTTTNLDNYVRYEMKSNLSEQSRNSGKSTQDCDNKAITFCNGVRSSLPEKSLPLKKKAKMKRTMVPENLRLLSRQDSGAYKQSDDTQITSERKSKHQTKDDSNGKSSSDSDSDEPLINRIKKRKKAKKSQSESKAKGKRSQKKSAQETDDEKPNRKNGDGSGTPKSAKGGTSNALPFSKNKFKTIYDLVEGLKKYKVINAKVGQILQSGLKEMNVDILKEMNAKLKEKSPVESTSYSTHLKVFALVLYFKQPSAFNYLGKLYEKGWPSLSAIKVWKREMNNNQRVSFRRRRKADETNLYSSSVM